MTDQEKLERKREKARLRKIAYRKRQKERGLTRHDFWMTDEEFQAAKKLLQELRANS